MTLPLITARERDPVLAELDLRSVTDAAQAEDVCERIAATGALDDARSHALALVAQAKRELDTARLGPGRADALRLVADSVVERYR